MGGSRAEIFWIQIFYLLALLGVAYVYMVWPAYLGIPKFLGQIPTATLWFGALGAILISLTGVFDHARDWDPHYKYWHWARPFMGGVMGVVAVLIMQAGLLAVGASISPTQQPVLYYIVAFVVAYRESTFRELIKRVTDVILTPGSPAVAPVAAKLSTTTGAAGAPLMITGSGLSGVTEVKFGAVPAFYRIDSDSQLTVTIPTPAPKTTGPVQVVVAGKGGNSTPGQFAY